MDVILYVKSLVVATDLWIHYELMDNSELPMMKRVMKAATVPMVHYVHIILLSVRQGLQSVSLAY